MAQTSVAGRGPVQENGDGSDFCVATLELGTDWLGSSPEKSLPSPFSTSDKLKTCRHAVKKGDAAHSLSATATAVTAASPRSSAAERGRSKTATPPIQPVKPTLRLEWITLPIVNGPPLVASAGV